MTDDHDHDHDTDSGIGERLRSAREARALELNEAAELMGVLSSTLEGWEAGHEVPRANKLQTLAGVLGVPMVWLVNLDEPGEAEDLVPTDIDVIEQKLQRLAQLQDKQARLQEEISADVASLRGHGWHTDRPAPDQTGSEDQAGRG